MVLRMVTSAAEASSQCSNSKPVRWSGVLGTGQSLSCGHAAPLWKPTEPILSALMLDDAADDVKTPRFDIRYPDSSTLRAVPLREPMHIVKRFVRGYPRNIAGKTPHSAMAAQISTMLAEKGESLTTVHSCVGIGGQPMSVINKSGSSNAYEASMYEARALTRLAREANSKLEYDAIIFTHGETDAIFGNPGYGHALIAFHKDYIADLKSITDQKHDPVLILSQQSTCPTDPREIKPCLVTQAEWRVQAVSKNAIICGLPKYQFGYSPDSLHFTAPGYDRLGEKYGQVFYQTVLEKKPFVPLSPQHVAFSSPKTIVVSFNVSSPPLQWDEILWWPHQDMHKQWSLGRGFEVSDAEGKPLNIDSVSLIPKTNSVSIVLGSEPSRLPLTLTYAMVQDAWNTRGGRAGGRVGTFCRVLRITAPNR